MLPASLKFTGALPLHSTREPQTASGDRKVSSRINGFDTPPVRVATGKAASRVASDQGSSGSNDTAAPDSGSNDSVSISTAARNLASLNQLVQEQPGIDAVRVAAIQQRIEDGTYQVNPQRIADKLMRMERDLPQGGKNGK
jgi:negative regulator of flagellin synthesis FlgM